MRESENLQSTKIILSTGEVFHIASPEDFVNQLNNTSRCKCDTAEQYMAEFAMRYQTISGTLIRYDNATNFYEDLKKTNYFIELPER